MKYCARIVTLAALPILCLLCCTTEPTSPAVPPLNLPSLVQQSTPLSVALVAAERIQDVRTRVTVYVEIARGYISTGDSQSAIKLLDRTLVVVRAFSLASQLPDVMANLADLYVKANRTDAAIPILQQSLADAEKIADPANRGVVLERIAESCIDAGAPAYDLLRATFQAIYVIDDLWVRASTLVDTARTYQQSGNGVVGATNVLIQQAIPAAGSITNPWLKSLALSEIALRLKAEGNSSSATYYGGRAFDAVNSVQVLRRTEGDAARVVSSAENLAQLGMISQSVAVLGTIEYPDLRAEGLARIAATIEGSGDVSRALQLCSEATDVAQSATDPLRRGEALATIALVYGQLRQDRLALATADVALESEPSIAQSVDRASLIEPIAEAKLRWGNATDAYAAIDRISDIYSRTSALIDLATRLLDDGLRFQASNSVSQAARLAPEAAYLQQNLYRGVADVEIRLGDFSSALLQISKLTDPYTLAVTLVDLQVAPRGASALSESDRISINEIGRALLAKTPSVAP